MHLPTALLAALAASLAQGIPEQPPTATTTQQQQRNLTFHMPTFRMPSHFVAASWAGLGGTNNNNNNNNDNTNSSSSIKIRCTDLGPQCVRFPAGAPANASVSLRLYCGVKRVSATGDYVVRPGVMDPCPRNTHCRVRVNEAQRPRPPWGTRVPEPTGVPWAVTGKKPKSPPPSSSSSSSSFANAWQWLQENESFELESQRPGGKFRGWIKLDGLIREVKDDDDDDDDDEDDNREGVEQEEEEEEDVRVVTVPWPLPSFPRPGRPKIPRWFNFTCVPNGT
ncbi:hypothetical protein F5Y19DRAFT_489042 [Xylariaceae sp. FL1651]|nr:hypothetical protein F5Y19DRAFT_489042 [Xylariaceae sp. FL1651]